MLKRILLLLFVAVVGSGCAAKSQFIYNYSSDQPAGTHGSLVAAMAPIKDTRTNIEDIDKIYSVKPLEEIQRIIHKELMSTGLFKQINLLQENEGDDPFDIRIEPSLNQMAWEVPNYEQILNKVFIVSLLTGGIGGVIYGCTSTDVYGDTRLHVKMTDNSSGRTIMDKEYQGHCEEKSAKISCDTPETKAKIIGNALKAAMEDLKADIKSALGESPDGMALSVDNP